MSDTREALGQLIAAIEKWRDGGGNNPDVLLGLLEAVARGEDALAAADGEVVEEDVDNGTFTFFHEDGLIVAASSDVMTAFVKAREVVAAHEAMVGPWPHDGPVQPTRVATDRFAMLLRDLELLVYPERRP